MNPRYVRKSFHGHRLIDLPTGDVLASTEDNVGWTSFLRSQVRGVLEREGRERAATLAVVGVAFVDTTNSPLRHEHHLIMRRGRRGLAGYDILTNVGAAAASTIVAA